MCLVKVLRGSRRDLSGIYEKCRRHWKLPTLIVNRIRPSFERIKKWEELYFIPETHIDECSIRLHCLILMFYVYLYAFFFFSSFVGFNVSELVFVNEIRLHFVCGECNGEMKVPTSWTE